MYGLIFRILKIALVLSLPFLALIRGSVYVHEQYNPGPYLSMLGGAGMTFLVLVLYMAFLFERLTDRIGGAQAFKTKGIFALILLIGFSVQGLFFISTENMKNEEIASEIRQLHPILRIAVSTIIFVDKDLIITDASRLPEDYHRMGLPSKGASLHYKQKDGYAYAMDLRTNHRSEIRNFFLRIYFRIMGFRTLRHTGTADHLHISLKCHYRPGAV